MSALYFRPNQLSTLFRLKTHRLCSVKPFLCHWSQKCILTLSLSIWQCQFCRSICFSGWIKPCTCFIISRIVSLAHLWWWISRLKWFFTVWYYRKPWFSNADHVEYVHASSDCWFLKYNLSFSRLSVVVSHGYGAFVVLGIQTLWIILVWVLIFVLWNSLQYW